VAKKEPRSLYGQVVAITGAARGIGKATARALVRQGARVGIGDLDVELARKTAEELGGSVEAFELNVCDRASFARFLDEVEGTLGPIDALINNAGIMPLGPFDEEDDATTLRQIDINLVGVMTGCKLAIPKMKQRGRGHIVNIASMAGRAGYSNAVTYCTTKFAVVGLSEALRSELRGTSTPSSARA
jgi:NADP-dependent 3-hydroxy acid dehydrogenase YdfG